MECVAMGVPAVTTDLSGFGAYVQRNVANHQEQGIYVLNRRTRSFEDAANELTDHLVQFVQLNRRQRVELRNRVERLGEMFDWSAMIVNYNEAHDLALSRFAKRHTGRLEVKAV